jgi:uncharacterized protein
MYEVIFIILFATGIFFGIQGIRKKKTVTTYIGVAVVVFTIFLIWFMDFWAEMLWFDALGYGPRFWIVQLSQGGLAAAFFIIGGLLVYLFTFSIPPQYKTIRYVASAFAAVISGIWGYANWENLLKFWNRVSTGLVDPLLGADTGFYMFTLPFLQSLQGLLFTLAIIALLASLVPVFVVFHPDGNVELRSIESIDLLRTRIYKSFYISTAILLFLLAWGKYLDRFALMFSDWGVVTGPGWTDTNVRYPALNVIMVITALAGILVLIPRFRIKIQDLLWKWRITNHPSPPIVVISLGAVLLFLWFIGLTALPGLLQWFRVVPNELTFERPYIEHGIHFTRAGFHLDKIEDQVFPYEERFTPTMVENNSAIFDNIRLWDYRALDNVFRQFQVIRPYYEFHDVDVDRYTLDGVYQQVLLSAREMEQRNLPAQSQGFVNRTFIYTHGFGLTMAKVNEFTPQGLPNLLIRNIPPVSSYPELEVEQPRIYFGERTNHYVVVNTTQQEFDFPSAEGNQHTHYQGNGGVQLSNIWRRFIYGYKFDGTKLFVSNYPTSESRIMFYRNINERVRNLAPFLRFDNDPYLVVSEGRLFWIIDAYTVSNNYPYSQRHQFINSRESINYIRNSVKVVVDAYHGSVDFYVFEPDDPLIQVWSKIFPDMFKSREEMPEGLLNHIRYPVQMMLIQGSVYSRYHMSDPTVFYNQEDLWIRATELYGRQQREVEPYYIIWQFPESDQPEYVVMMPFTPRNRQVMVGWIAGMCDPENYGRLIAYRFPRDRHVLGPQQVETKIDQDSFLAGQLSLWDQRGSSVIRGNVLAIPVENTLVYIEPIYLQAETAAYPELRLVVVMHGDDMSYAPTFDQALRGLFTGTMAAIPAELQERTEPGEPGEEQPRPIATGYNQMVQEANQAFEDYLRHTGTRNFEQASRALTRLENALRNLTDNQ